MKFAGNESDREHVTPSRGVPPSAGAAPRARGGETRAARRETARRGAPALTSPGRGPDPPPTSPAAEMVWCGARKGRVVSIGCIAEQPGDAVNLGNLDRLGERWSGKDPSRYAARASSCRLPAVRPTRGCGRRLRRSPARAWRAVARAPPRDLPRRSRRRQPLRRRRDFAASQRAPLEKEFDRFAERRNPVHLHARNERRLAARSRPESASARMPSAAVASAIASAPRTGFTRPSSDSSPTMTWPARRSGGTVPGGAPGGRARSADRMPSLLS